MFGHKFYWSMVEDPHSSKFNASVFKQGGSTFTTVQPRKQPYFPGFPLTCLAHRMLEAGLGEIAVANGWKLSPERSRLLIFWSSSCDVDRLFRLWLIAFGQVYALKHLASLCLQLPITSQKGLWHVKMSSAMNTFTFFRIIKDLVQYNQNPS